MHSYWIPIALLFLVVVILLQWRFIARTRRKPREQEGKNASLQAEKCVSDEMPDDPADEQLRIMIEKRAALLKRMLAASVSGDTSRTESVLEEVDKLVSNRQEFMRETRLIYERKSPGMIAKLRECGLDDDEIEICCLYALGLNGKAIQQYTQNSRHYQNVGQIRKKLGLGEHDKNIDGYIKSLMK